MKNEVWFAPGRANLMGEHTDYNDGFVLPFALAQGVTANAAARDDGLLVVRSKQVPDEPLTVPLAAVEPGSIGGWGAYPAGVAWALRATGYAVRGAEIDLDSDLPVGAGVSSSAAIECAVALALCSLSGLSLSRPDLALLAKRAENDFVGAPTGIIDQSASLRCQADHAMLLDCGTMGVTQVPFLPSAAGMTALVIDTRVPHALVAGQFAARRAECEEATRLLGLGPLGSIADAAVVESLADPLLRRRARHVITDSLRAQAIATALAATAAVGASVGADEGEGGDAPDAPGYDYEEIYRYIGSVLLVGHASLRDDFEVSWDEADTAVEVAMASGAYGAKMIGGGFGGSVLAMVPTEHARIVRTAVTEAFAGQGWTPPDFLDAIPSPAARRLS